MSEYPAQALRRLVLRTLFAVEGGDGAFTRFGSDDPEGRVVEVEEGQRASVVAQQSRVHIEVSSRVAADGAIVLGDAAEEIVGLDEVEGGVEFRTGGQTLFDSIQDGGTGVVHLLHLAVGERALREDIPLQSFQLLVDDIQVEHGLDVVNLFLHLCYCCWLLAV